MHGSAYDGSDVIFCPNPDCSHNSRECICFFPPDTEFFAMDGRVYRIYPQAGYVLIEKIDFYQGTTPVAKVPDCNVGNDNFNIATDGDCFYISCRINGYRYAIKQVNIADGKSKVIYTLPKDEFGPTIHSIVGGNIILSSDNMDIGPTPSTVFAVNIKSGKARAIKRIDNMLRVGETAGVIDGENLYLMDSKNNIFIKYNLFTGQSTEIADKTLPYIEGYFHTPRITVENVHNGKALITYRYSTETENYNPIHLLIDLESGMYMNAPTLSVDRMNPQTVLPAPILAQLEGAEIGQITFVTYDTYGRLAMLSPDSYAKGSGEYIYIDYAG